MNLGETNNTWLELSTSDDKKVRIKFSSIDVVQQWSWTRAYVYVGPHLFEVMITSELKELFRLS